MRKVGLIALALLATICVGLIYIFISERQRYAVREQLDGAYFDGLAAVRIADDYRSKNGVYPGDLGMAGFSPTSRWVSSSGITREGEITIRVSIPEVQSKSLIFTPTTEIDTQRKWLCRSPDISEDYLRASCKP